MGTQYDFKKEWPKIKKQLTQLSNEALDLARKGEKEIVRLSRRGKLHVDATAIAVQKERLYYLIGKEYIKAKCPGELTLKLKQLVGEKDKLDKNMAVLKKRMETRQTKKSTGDSPA